jgi:redox-sensitive bicupin YhaK (pirin superfamily)
LEGAGVHLKRAFGNRSAPNLDPFLLLDEFHNDNPAYYMKGFPWHPHRGIETITYMLHGNVRHGDSMGNKGIIGPGDVQWMTAGSGIIHEEMPQSDKPLLWGFQLWANLPKSHKMMDPRYRDVNHDTIPSVKTKSGAEIKIICGAIDGIQGPVQDIITDPEYFDVSIPPDGEFLHDIKLGYTAFCYAFKGEGIFDPTMKSITPENLIVLSDGDQVQVKATEKGCRFLFVAGKPIKEPVAWYGPIVMNTQEELRIAFEEYQNGTFIKKKFK